MCEYVIETGKQSAQSRFANQQQWWSSIPTNNELLVDMTNWLNMWRISVYKATDCAPSLCIMKTSILSSDA